MLGSPLRPFLYKETIIVCLSFFRNFPFRTTMPIAQDKLSKFGINLRGECQLCFFTVSNRVVLYETWAIKCSPTMLSKSHEILKKNFSYSSVVPIFAFQWSGDTLRSIRIFTIGFLIFWPNSNVGRFDQFSEISFSCWKCQNNFWTLTTKLSRNKLSCMIDILIFKLVLTFPILAGILAYLTNLGIGSIWRRRNLVVMPPQFCRGNHQLEGRE